MRKWTMAFAVVAALATAGGAVMAATLSNGAGQTCAGTALWHFVNNQTGGAPAGTLEACFSSGGVVTCTSGVQPTSILSNTQHFYVTATGTVVSAQTNLPGKLVLSHFTCQVEEPPKCDPKTDPDCKK
jgi:hypothetical protein